MITLMDNNLAFEMCGKFKMTSSFPLALELNCHLIFPLHDTFKRSDVSIYSREDASTTLERLGV